jgi:hypothetical protein
VRVNQVVAALLALVAAGALLLQSYSSEQGF